MIAPNSAPVNSPERGRIIPVTFESFEGLPPLPDERLKADFSKGENVLFLFDRSWMEGPQFVEGKIDHIVPSDRPFVLRLPRGVMSQGLVDHVIEQSGGKIKKKELTTGLNPEPLRQLMLNTPGLRDKIPSAGFITLETPKTADNPTGAIIGIDMNLASLIPEVAWPHLRDNAPYRRAWLASGNPDGLTDERMLVQVMRDRLAEKLQSPHETTHSTQRAKSHPREISGRVGPHPPAYV
jgi:hypothetical protein